MFYIDVWLIEIVSLIEEVEVVVLLIKMFFFCFIWLLFFLYNRVLIDEFVIFCFGEFLEKIVFVLCDVECVFFNCL